MSNTKTPRSSVQLVITEYSILPWYLDSTSQKPVLISATRQESTEINGYTCDNDHGDQFLYKRKGLKLVSKGRLFSKVGKVSILCKKAILRKRSSPTVTNHHCLLHQA
jgi:hypothetical protein